MQATPNNAEIYYQLGLAYGASGDLQAAANAFQRALSINPDYKAAKLRLSELIALNEASSLLSDAETGLSSLLRESGPNSDALNALALTELRLGKSEQAQQTLLEATSKFPAQSDLGSASCRGVVSKSKDIHGAEQILKNLSQKCCAISGRVHGFRELLHFPKPAG